MKWKITSECMKWKITSECMKWKITSECMILNLLTSSDVVWALSIYIQQQLRGFN